VLGRTPRAQRVAPHAGGEHAHAVLECRAIAGRQRLEPAPHARRVRDQRQAFARGGGRVGVSRGLARQRIGGRAVSGERGQEQIETARERHGVAGPNVLDRVGDAAQQVGDADGFPERAAQQPDVDRERARHPRQHVADVGAIGDVARARVGVRHRPVGHASSISAVHVIVTAAASDCAVGHFS
jgi:hypothetical protein